ncbi:MAG: hypothetical protein P4L40_02040, partial [Terracidiphilus sp.]|nr:hypothetical protein [Terracidiphilus sp.]
MRVSTGVASAPSAPAGGSSAASAAASACVYPFQFPASRPVGVGSCVSVLADAATVMPESADTQGRIMYCTVTCVTGLPPEAPGSQPSRTTEP